MCSVATCHVDHVRLTAESDSYRSVSENIAPMIPNVLESVRAPSPVSDESVCQPVSVPQNTRSICQGTARQDCGFINTTVYSRGDTSIRKANKETSHSGSVMSHVHVLMQGDWILYWRLTLKLKRSVIYWCYTVRCCHLLTMSSKEPLHRCRYNAVM